MLMSRKCFLLITKLQLRCFTQGYKCWFFICFHTWMCGYVFVCLYLNMLKWLYVKILTTFCFVCRDIGCDLYVDHYCRDLPELMVIGSHATTVSLTQGIKNMTSSFGLNWTLLFNFRACLCYSLWNLNVCMLIMCFCCQRADDLRRIQFPSFYSPAPPNINHWICSYLRQQECPPFPCIPSVSIRTERAISVCIELSYYISVVCSI